jgi:predicted PP-loop superfamily ATPase
MTIQPLDTPQKLAYYLTDNERLQTHLAAFLALTSDKERELLENKFWLFASTLSHKEQKELKDAKAKVAQRMLDRTSSTLLFFKEEKAELGVLV